MPFPQLRIRHLWRVSLVCLPFCLHAAEDRLLFRAAFDGTAEAETGLVREPVHVSRTVYGEGPHQKPAISVPVGGELIYEGAGSAFIPSGAVSFWWRPDEPVQSVEASVLAISSFQRFYFCRWLRITTKGHRLHATLHHGDSAEVAEDAGSLPGAPAEGKSQRIRYELGSRVPLKQGEWHHVVATWDFGRGFAFYVDGKLARWIKTPWFFGANVNHIALASASTGYSKPRPATVAQSFADVRIYDGWLEPADVAALANGENPELTTRFEPMFEERNRRYGLGGKEALPPAPPGAENALWLRQIGVEKAKDVLRRSFSGVDGDFGRAWPMYQGYSGSGKKLAIQLPADSRFNTVQLFGSGPMEVQAEGKLLLDASSPKASLQSAFLSQPVETHEVDILRTDGFLFTFSLYDAEARPFPSAGSDGWHFHPLGQAPAGAEPLLEREFAPYDRHALAAEGGEKPAFTLPAGAALHLLGPKMNREEGVAAVAFELALEEASGAGDVSVAVIDPVSHERRTAFAAFRASDAGSTLRLVLDLRDLLYASGQRPWVVVHSSVPMKIDPKRSRIGLRQIPAAVAQKEFFKDQLSLVDDAFQEMSEGRPWAHDPKKLKGLGSLLARIDTLRQMDATNPLVQGYWHWTHPREETPWPDLPAVPENIPPWALYTRNAVERFRQAAHWWIDERQTPEGEFGAPDGINDDTDLIQDWLAIDLMDGPDPKIRDSVRRVADLSWRETTTDGISNKVTDTLHIYEWGINAQTLAFLLEYGDPVYFERLLRFASHYPELMTEACDGKHLHFKSWYFGINRIVTEGIYGRDIQQNTLLLQPAMLLAWYNGDPVAREVVTRWTDAMRDHTEAEAASHRRVPGFSVAIPSGKIIRERVIRLADAAWASWKLSDDPAYRRFAGQLIDYEMTRKPSEGLHSTSSIAGAYLNETADPRWDKRWVEEAKAVDASRHSLHNSNYRPLDYNYAAWLRTGEDDWLNRGSALALRHMTWSQPMLTEAGATTDRVWLPQRLANQMTLGGLSIIRNQIFPKHVVSWERPSGRFAPLVRKQAADRLELEVWNLDVEKPLTVGMRLWGLEPGRYEQVTRVQTDPNAEPEEIRTEREVERYTLTPLEIPAGASATITFQQKQKLPPLTDRPDLAISPLDAVYDPATKVLTTVVHNIGRKPADAFRIVAEQDGKEIASQTVASLGPPEAYRTQKVRFPVTIEEADRPVTIRVELEKPVREITAFNNRVEVTPSACPPTAP